MQLAGIPVDQAEELLLLVEVVKYKVWQLSFCIPPPAKHTTATRC